MFRLKTAIYFVVAALFLSSAAKIYAQPASQTAGGVQSREREMEKQKALEGKIEEKKKKPDIQEEAPAGASLAEGKKVLIKKIIVEGADLLTVKEINKVTAQFEGKELNLSEMQKVADLLTDAYRSKNYVTSRAYLAPQTIKDGVLVIKVIEGKLGKVEIKGNRFFKSSLLRKKLKVQQGGYFDYSALQKSLVYINDSPDRVAKAILVPGKDPGTTDIVLEVKDRFPMHVGFDYDNWGSRFIEKNRWSFNFEYNNLLGLDDRVSFKLQKSEASLYELKAGRYLLPLKNGLEIGAYYSHSDLKLGKEFKPLDARGKATVIGAFLNKSLIDKENLDLRFSFGFDYKHIINYLLGAESSRDEVRLFKQGLDLDVTDKFGRTIILSELDIGVPDIMGGMPEKDNFSSRGVGVGAGGKFYKGIFNIFRLQPMPFSTALLLKANGQVSGYNLVASEQMQIGGPTSVRGYSPGEFSGDKGWYTAAEWSMPVYFIPKKLNIPFGHSSWYDAIRLVAFYDWASVKNNTLLAGDKKSRTLKGLSARVEFGYPLGMKPLDGDNVHPWVECIYKF
jgi:hemolysin activation/secretion protein